MPLAHQTHRKAPRRGLSLVEVMVSLVSASMLVAGLSSTILIARKAGQAASVSPATIASGNAVAQLTHDLAYANSFVERSTTAVEFTVPDRNQDGQSERIRYQWAGAGSPLLRKQNDSPFVQLAPSLQLFELGYDLQPFVNSGGASNKTGEMVLGSEVSDQNLGAIDLTSSQFLAQYLTPSLPASTTSWRISRVRLRLRSSGSTSGVALVQVRTATLGGALPQPSSTVIAERTLYEASLTPDFNWYDVTLIDSPEVSASTSLCIVLKQVVDSVPCTLEYRQSGASGSTTGLLKSLFGGLVWIAASGQSLRIQIYGTVTTSGAAPPSNLYTLNQVSALLRVADTESQVETQIPVLNRPEVLGP
jgi:hypothetical protein